MKQHTHCELIKAWADGAIIEGRIPIDSKWITIIKPSWDEDAEFRIKLEWKPKNGEAVWVKMSEGDQWSSRVATGKNKTTYWLDTTTMDDWVYCVPFKDMPNE